MEPLFSFGFLSLPTVFISLALLGALLALAWPRLGIAVAIVSSLCLYATATPALSSFLMRQAEVGLPANPDLSRAQAIVVLGGGVRPGDGAAIPDRLNAWSLKRIYLGASAYRRLHLPVAVSGGMDAGAHQSEAGLMKAALERDFAVPVAWSEDRSRTTWENAVFTARLLRPAGIGTVVLVTEAWHLPRALWAFQRAGLTALSWPAPRTALELGTAGDLLPNIGALQNSFYGLHELIGKIYYRLRY